MANVLALGLLAFLGTLVALQYGRSAWVGLFFPAYWGFSFSLARDLSELVAAAATLTAILFLTQDRWTIAAGCLVAAILTREQAVVAGTLLLGGAAWDFFSGRLLKVRVAATACLAAIPALALSGWNLVVYAVAGEFPVVGGQNNIGPPVVGIAEGAVVWVEDVVGASSAALRVAAGLHLLQFGALVVVVVLAGLMWKTSEAGTGPKAALLGVSVLFVVLSGTVFRAPAFFRTSYDVYILAVVVVVASPLRLRIPAVAVTAISSVSWAAMVLRV